MYIQYVRIKNRVAVDYIIKKQNQEKIIRICPQLNS